MRRSLLVVFVASLVAAQEAPVEIVPRTRPKAAPAVPEPKANIRIDTNVVLVPVTVTDPLNRFVGGLEQTDFKVFEDEVEQKITSFGGEDTPLSIGIVFDTSGSMGNKLQMSRVAVAEFFKLANPEDEGFLVEFRDRPELVVPFTHNPGEIQNRLLITQSKGSTALLDGVTMAMSAMKKATNPRKALIVITDGGDNHSRYTASEVRNRVKEADVQIYAMGIYGGANSPEELAGPSLLRDLAEKIGIELRNEYLIGYSPSNGARDGKYRKITVKVIQPPGLPKLRSYWRKGYVAPTQ